MGNKVLIVLLIIVLIIISIALIGFMFFMINGRGFMFGWSSVSTELVAEEEYDNTFKKINIDTDAADVYVKEGKDEKIKVLVYGEKDKTKLENRDEELEIITHEKKNIFFSFGMKKAKVEIYIPKDYKEKLVVKNKYGDIEIEKFLNAEMEIEEDCGDVSVKGAKKANIKNNFGDIKLEEVEITEIKQSAGNVEVETAEDIKVKNNYGNIKINKINNYLEIEADCGDIKINNLTLNKNAEIKNNFGDIKIGNTNEIYIEAKTSLGDVKVNNNYPKSDVTLKLKNDCGDIKVDN